MGRVGAVDFLFPEPEGSWVANVFFPKEYDWEGFTVDHLELVSSCPAFDPQLLNKLSRSVYAEIQRREPEWIPYAINSVVESGYLDIFLPSPLLRGGYMVISTTSNQDVKICFPPETFTLDQIGGDAETMSIADQMEILLRYLEAIFNEDLVAISTGEWLGGGTTVDVFGFYRLVARKKIKRATSWRGTFNLANRGSPVPAPPQHIIAYQPERRPVVKCDKCEWTFPLDEFQFRQCEYTCPRCQTLGRFGIPHQL